MGLRCCRRGREDSLCETAGRSLGTFGYDGYGNPTTYKGKTLAFDPENRMTKDGTAMKRSTGARALRSIIEEVMMDIMYDIPSQTEIKEVVITGEMVREATSPRLVTTDELRAAS